VFAFYFRLDIHSLMVMVDGDDIRVAFTKDLQREGTPERL